MASFSTAPGDGETARTLNVGEAAMPWRTALGVRLPLSRAGISINGNSRKAGGRRCRPCPPSVDAKQIRDLAAEGGEGGISLCRLE